MMSRAGWLQIVFFRCIKKIQDFRYRQPVSRKTQCFPPIIRSSFPRRILNLSRARWEMQSLEVWQSSSQFRKQDQTEAGTFERPDPPRLSPRPAWGVLRREGLPQSLSSLKNSGQQPHRTESVIVVFGIRNLASPISPQRRLQAGFSNEDRLANWMLMLNSHLGRMCSYKASKPPQ